MGKMQQGRRLQGLGELQARMGSNGACARPMGCRGGKKLSQWGGLNLVVGGAAGGVAIWGTGGGKGGCFGFRRGLAEEGGGPWVIGSALG